MNADDLGDLPEPKAEEPELYPGGVDSLKDEEKYGERLDEPATPDLPLESNPAVEEDEVPDEITEQDDKQQEPEGQADDQESGAEDDPEAGQENEKGEPEAPA